MNDITNKTQNAMALYSDDDFEDTKRATSGLSSGLALIRLKGSTFILDEGGERKSVGVSFPGVIVGVGDISKRFFKNKNYQEGEAPWCTSVDGKKPDPGCSNQQSETCANCPMNIWGSDTSEISHKQIKRCKDYRRLVIAIISDNYDNGYKLYRMDLPVMSLQPFKLYAQNLKEHNGCPLFGVATKFSFDLAAKYPVVKFEVFKVANEQNLAIIRKIKTDSRIKELLSAQYTANDEAGEEKTETVTARKPAQKKAEKPKQEAPQQMDMFNDAPAGEANGADLDNFDMDLPDIVAMMDEKLA